MIQPSLPDQHHEKTNLTLAFSRVLELQRYRIKSYTIQQTVNGRVPRTPNPWLWPGPRVCRTTGRTSGLPISYPKTTGYHYTTPTTGRPAKVTPRQSSQKHSKSHYCQHTTYSLPGDRERQKFTRSYRYLQFPRLRPWQTYLQRKSLGAEDEWLS